MMSRAQGVHKVTLVAFDGVVVAALAGDEIARQTLLDVLGDFGTNTVGAVVTDKVVPLHEARAHLGKASFSLGVAE